MSSANELFSATHITLIDYQRFIHELEEKKFSLKIQYYGSGYSILVYTKPRKNLVLINLDRDNIAVDVTRSAGPLMRDNLAAWIVLPLFDDI